MIEFNSHAKFLVLREKLKKAIFRLVIEKYKKTVGPKGLSTDERDKFKAEIYTYLNEQIKVSIDLAIDMQKESLHHDIVHQNEFMKDVKARKKTFNETDQEREMRLYREFDIIGDKKSAERHLQTAV